MARRKRNGVTRQIIGLTAAGFTAGIGATAVGRVGGVTATNAATGIANTTRFFPQAGTIIGFRLLLRPIRRLRRLR